IDVAAKELQIDPIELRRRNLIPSSAMPFKTGLVFTYDCGEFARGMDMALSLADRAGFEKRRTEARQRGKLRGFGIANPIEVAGGSAVTRAAEKIIERGRRIAAGMLEAAPEDLVHRDGKFTVAGTDRGVTLANVARAAYVPRQLPKGMEPGFSEEASFTPPAVTFPNGSHICEVEVDEDTGAVRVVRHTVVDDVGHMVNPMVVKGQIHGGVVQGLGQGLYEELTYDPTTGQLLAGSFMDYAMPRADDVPAFDVDSHEVPTAVNPPGAKGVG